MMTDAYATTSSHKIQIHLQEAAPFSKYILAFLFFPVSPVFKGRHRDILQLLTLLVETPANSRQRVFVHFQPIRVIPKPGSESDGRLISGIRQGRGEPAACLPSRGRW